MKMSVSNEMIDRARAMIPALKQRAVVDEKDRRVSEKTVADIKNAGLIGVMKPAKWGGHELNPMVFSEIGMALAEGDMAVAWVYGLWANHAYHLAFYDDRAQADVWSNTDEEPLISSSYSPSGKATRVDGGYQLSGRWKWSSGSAHSNWLLLSSFPSDKPGEVVCFLVPRKDISIIDTWFVTGLKSTGSNDIVVEDVFVPEYRGLAFSDLFKGTSPGTNNGPLYKLSPITVFYRVITLPMIGALQALVDEFVVTGEARSTSSGPITDNPDALLALGQAMGAIEEMKHVQRQTFETLMELAERGETASVSDRLRYRYQSSYVAETCILNAKALFEATSGLAMMEEATSTGRIYRNLISARQHIGSQYRKYARSLAADRFGAETKDIML